MRVVPQALIIIDIADHLGVLAQLRRNRTRVVHACAVAAPWISIQEEDTLRSSESRPNPRAISLHCSQYALWN